jgi:hypothetical protein
MPGKLGSQKNGSRGKLEYLGGLLSCIRRAMALGLAGVSRNTQLNSALTFLAFFSSCSFFLTLLTLLGLIDPSLFHFMCHVLVVGQVYVLVIIERDHSPC